MRRNCDYSKLRDLFGQNLGVSGLLDGGSSVDLFELFRVVRERGGCASVAKFGQWGVVAEEVGLSSGDAASLQGFYIRHLGLLDQWIHQSLRHKDVDIELLPVGLERKLREILFDLSNKSRASEEEEGLLEIDDRVSISTDMHGTGNTTKSRNVDKCVVDQGDVNMDESVEENFTVFSGMLNWLKESARNPGNAYNGKGFTTLVLLAREALIQRRRDDMSLEENGDHRSVIELRNVEKDVGEEVVSRKRKRATFAGMMNWLRDTAKNPGRPVFQNIGKAYKQKEYKGEQIPSLVLLARDALLQKRSIGKSVSSPSQKRQKMHPSMYEDQDHSCMKSLRFSPRILSQINRQLDPCHESSDLDVTATPFAEENDPFDDGWHRKLVPVGPLSQADVPEWTGTPLESDPKWLGTLHWSLKTNEQSLRANATPVGKGRQDSCHCRDPGSIECVKAHITDENERLKSELKIVFYVWKFQDMGEGVLKLWTAAEEKKFNSTVRLNPPSMNKFFWNKLRAYFRTKSWKCLVSYYFNVFVLRRRTYQNRLTPCNIDSDDDESEVGSW